MNYWNKVKEFFSGFTAWDFFIIIIVADVSQSFILSLLFGAATWWGFGWFVMFVLLWHLHVYGVKEEIRSGLR